jgi:hypothetical protein
MAEYNYKRELKVITDQWHKIILPNELFGKTTQNLTDFRIFGLAESNDTIEAPYLLRLTSEKISIKDVAFKTLNSSHNDKGYYFTFEIPIIESINQIKLDFKQENFDWQIRLEGSQDQNEWFTVIENYRILSIKNNQTDFQFTKVTFPSSKYRFFRLFIDSQEKPELSVASITQNDITDGTFRKYSVKKINGKENKQTKQTEINVELELPVRVSNINIGVSDTFDYYRPVTIKYLTDSFKTEQGWKYNYSTLTSGTLNSIEKNEFQFSSTTVQKLKIYIDNQDNQPLKIDTVEVKGYVHELVARFTDHATYFLTYGNKKAAQANYDIERFTENIPETMTALDLGDELTIEKEEVQVTAPLFKNKIWLWTIMTVIILLLGWFSLKMIRKK